MVLVQFKTRGFGRLISDTMSRRSGWNHPRCRSTKRDIGTVCEHNADNKPELLGVRRHNLWHRAPISRSVERKSMGMIHPDRVSI